MNRLEALVALNILRIGIFKLKKLEELFGSAEAIFEAPAEK